MLELVLVAAIMSSAVTAESHRSLLSAIIAYLASLKQSPFAAELGTASDSLDAALDCLTEATGISLSAAAASASSSPSLLSLFTAAQSQSQSSSASSYPSDSDPRFQQFLKLLTDSGFFTGLSVGSAAYSERLAAARLRYSEKYPQPQQPAASPAAAAAPPKPVSAEDRAAAEKLKNEGNSFLSAGRPQQAAERYSAALALNPASAIYFANRAAAFIALSRWEKGEEDSRAAIALDPQYGKAHYRLGQCLLSLHRAEEAVAAFERALQHTDASMKGTIEEQLQAARALVAGGGGAAEEAADSEEAEGAGGLDFSSIMSNPMFAQMASQLAGGGGAGGGLDFNSLLNNPQIMQMAASMFGGGGGAAAAAAGGSARPSAASSAPSAASPSVPSSDSIISSFLNSPAGAALASDPVMAPVIADVQANGPSALSKHMSNPAVVAKLNALAGPLISSAKQQGAAEKQRSQGH